MSGNLPTETESPVLLAWWLRDAAGILRQNGSRDHAAKLHAAALVLLAQPSEPEARHTTSCAWLRAYFADEPTEACDCQPPPTKEPKHG